MKLLHWSWQDLNEARRYWQHGRAWLRLRRRNSSKHSRTFRIEWCVGRGAGGLRCELQVGGEDDAVLGVALPFLALWFAIADLVPFRWLPRDWHRSTGVRVFAGAIWLDFWNDDSGWRGKRRQWVLHIEDLLLGRHRCTKTELSSHEVVIPMPERSYPATVRMERCRWKRPRWFATEITRGDVQ